jgi:hypothetical protein
MSRELTIEFIDAHFIRPLRVKSALADWVRPHPDFRSSLKADLTAHGDPGRGFKSLGDHGRNRAVGTRAYPQSSKTFFARRREAW